MCFLTLSAKKKKEKKAFDMVSANFSDRVCKGMNIEDCIEVVILKYDY